MVAMMAHKSQYVVNVGTLSSAFFKLIYSSAILKITSMLDMLSYYTIKRLNSSIAKSIPGIDPSAVASFKIHDSKDD